MDDDKLLWKANNIAAFFRAYPAAEAEAGIRDHILAFWTPRMRATLLTRAAEMSGRLDPLVAAALRHLPAAASPIAKEVAGPEELGQLASDAG